MHNNLDVHLVTNMKDNYVDNKMYYLWISVDKCITIVVLYSVYTVGKIVDNLKLV